MNDGSADQPHKSVIDFSEDGYQVERKLRK